MLVIVTDASGKLIPSNPSAKKPGERDQLVFQKSKSIFTIASKAFSVQARKVRLHNWYFVFLHKKISLKLALTCIAIKIFFF